MKNLLFVGAHVDDEQCAAGTLVKLREEYSIFVLALSPCTMSTLEIGCDPTILVEEFWRSMKVLGVSNYDLLDFKVREFPEHRQAILDTLIKYRKVLEPDLVITASIQDRHQDHWTVACEVRRAFPHATLLGFETPRSPLTTNHRCYVELAYEHIKQKERCVKCYESQKVRGGMAVALVQDMARFRGIQAGCEYAEAFEVVTLKL